MLRSAPSKDIPVSSVDIPISETPIWTSDRKESHPDASLLRRIFAFVASGIPMVQNFVRPPADSASPQRF
jgi:hypothetical protein